MQAQWSFKGSADGRKSDVADDETTRWQFTNAPSSNVEKGATTSSNFWSFNKKSDASDVAESSNQQWSFSNTSDASVHENKPENNVQDISSGDEVLNPEEEFIDSVKKRDKNKIYILFGALGIVLLVIASFLVFKTKKSEKSIDNIKIASRKVTIKRPTKKQIKLGKKLLKATSKKRYKKIKKLIKKGAFINQRSKKGNTALIIAVKKKKYKIVKYLLKKGGDVSIKNKKKKSAYYYAKKIKGKTGKKIRKILKKYLISMKL